MLVIARLSSTHANLHDNMKTGQKIIARKQQDGGRGEKARKTMTKMINDTTARTCAFVTRAALIRGARNRSISVSPLAQCGKVRRCELQCVACYIVRNQVQGKSIPSACLITAVYCCCLMSEHCLVLFIVAVVVFCLRNCWHIV